MADSDRNIFLKTYCELFRERGINTGFRVTVLLLATSLMLSPSKSLAVGCPSGPDHWFNVIVSIDPQSLPSGVTAESVVEDTGNTEVYITNSTKIPLIINPLAYLKDATTIPSPDPAQTYQGAYPRPLTLKLVSGEGFYCDVHSSRPMRCDMNIQVNKDNALLDTPEVSTAINAGWIMRDDRPQGVNIPPPQGFQFVALYGNRQIPLQGKVSFSLNNNYNPRLGAETEKMCERFPPSGNAQAASDEWYKCQSDAQCLIVVGNCDVEWAANRDFVEQLVQPHHGQIWFVRNRWSLILQIL